MLSRPGIGSKASLTWVCLTLLGGGTDSLASVTGTPDPAFKTVRFGGGQPVTAVFQSQGRLLIGGTFSMVNDRPSQPLVRVNADGTVDATFSFGAFQNGSIRALLPLPDGTCLVGGSFQVSSAVGDRFGLVMIDSSGSVMTAFPYLANSGGEIWSMALDATGRILVAGNLNNGFQVARLLPTGRSDPSFQRVANDGSLPGLDGSVQKILMFSDGRILILGQFNGVRGLARAGLAVLQADGALDTTFDFRSDHDCCLTDALIAEDGKILVGGTFSTFNGLRRAGLIRLTSNGQLDLSMTSLPGPMAQVKSIAHVGSNQLLVSGAISAAPGTNWWTTVRLFSDGEVDSAFRPEASLGTGELLVSNSTGEIYQVQSISSAQSGGSYQLQRLLLDTAPVSAPRVFSDPQSVEVPEGGLVVLEVDHLANPRPTYQWLFGGATLEGATNRALQIENVRLAAAGDYQLRIENGLGSVTSSPLHLTVIPAPSNPGRVAIEFNPGPGVLNGPGSMLGLPDGKILITGSFAQVQGLPRARVARLLPDGTVDPDFVPETGEFASTTFPAATTNGSIVLLGVPYPTGTGQRSKIVRLRADGRLDPSFIPYYVPLNVNVQALCAGSDGFVYAGGTEPNFSGLFRLRSDGARDPDYRMSMDNVPAQILQQTDGKLVLLGWFSAIGDAPRNHLARLNADGSLDLTFAPEAIYSDSTPEHIAIQTDGKIIVSDSFYGGFGQPAASRLVRFNQDGSRDLAFTPEINPSDQIIALAAQPSGTIVLATTPFVSVDPSTAALLRLFPDGSIDHGFDPPPDASLTTTLIPIAGDRLLLGGSFTRVWDVPRNGIAELDARPSPPIAPVLLQALAGDQLPTGAVLSLRASIQAVPGAAYQWQRNGADLIGQTNRSLILWNVTRADAGEYRIKAANALGSITSLPAKIEVLPPETTPGAVDVSFFAGTGPNGAVNDLVELPDGKILIAGNFTAVDGHPRPRIACFNADGSLDESFAPPLGPDNEISSLVALDDGQIVIGGPFDSVAGIGRAYIATLRPDGGLNETNQISADARVTRLTLTPDGRIVGCGEGFLRQWNGNGTRDSTFADFNFDGVALAAVVQPDGKVLIAGNLTVDGETRPNIARVLPTGSADPAFQPGFGANDLIDDLALLPTGQILVGGAFTFFNGVQRGRIARLNADGTVDASFNTVIGAADGRVLAVGHHGMRDLTSVQSIAVQPNGLVFIAGEFTTYDGVPVASFLRLYPDGVIDLNFFLGTGFPAPSLRQVPWFNEYSLMSSRWISRVRAVSDERLFVMGNFPTINRIGRQGLVKMISDTPLTAPVARSTREDFDARTGTNILLRAQVLASPRPAFQWLHNGQAIPGANGVALSLTNVGRDAAGEYTCMVSNALGNLEIAAAKVAILPPRLEAGAVDAGFYAPISDVVQLTYAVFEADGKTVLSGVIPDRNGPATPWIGRLDSKGKIELTWDTQSLRFSEGLLGRADLRRGVSLDDGGVLVAGSVGLVGTNGTTQRVNWIRIRPDGTLDLDYKGPAGTSNIYGLTKLGDGRIVAAGDTSRGNGLIWINSDGTPDQNSNTVSFDNPVFEIVEDPQRRLMLAGDFTVVEGLRAMRVARLTPAGTLDTTFNPGVGPDGSVISLALQTDGSIVICGWFGNVAGKSKPHLARLHPNGTLDSAFPNSNIAADSGDVTAVALGPDGKILIAGFLPTYSDQGGTAFQVMRLHPDGAVDSTFNPGSGFAPIIQSLRLGWVNPALAITATGKLMVAGAFSAIDDLPRPQLARLFLEGRPRMVLRASARDHVGEIIWDDGVLEEAEALPGPWTSVPNAKPPWALQSMDGQKFLRLRFEP